MRNILFLIRKRDNRFEMGCLQPVALEYHYIDPYTLFSECSYSQSLAWSNKSYMINQIPQYNQTFGFSVVDMLLRQRGVVVHVGRWNCHSSNRSAIFLSTKTLPTNEINSTPLTFSQVFDSFGILWIKIIYTGISIPLIGMRCIKIINLFFC
jgi:hypothetical protein